MKSLSMQAKMMEMVDWLKQPTWCKQYSQFLFRTVKYCHRWPSEGFKILEKARFWVRDFVRWYNTEHRHSRIKFITPEQRHRGEDQQILVERAKLFLSNRRVSL